LGQKLQKPEHYLPCGTTSQDEKKLQKPYVNDTSYSPTSEVRVVVTSVSTATELKRDQMEYF